MDALKRTPHNSSLPPSTEHPHAKPEPKKRRPAAGTKPKKRGAQPGHPRKVRELLPTQDCDEVIPLRPQRCRKCAKKLQGSDPHPLRHQVAKIPVPQPFVTEYQRHRLLCQCGATTCAALPAGVPTGQCGPRLAAFCGLLMGHFRQSKRRAGSFLGDLLGVPCSPGWMIKIQLTLQPYEAVLAGIGGNVLVWRDCLRAEMMVRIGSWPRCLNVRKIVIVTAWQSAPCSVRFP
jgi:transposase